jgi:DNA (cytosine-5)-methyltransferase 1
VLENVRGHLSLGFGTVLGDLASIGYDAEWQVIPAAAVGAPHRRDRVFIVAYAAEQGLQGAIGQVTERHRDGLADGGEELPNTIGKLANTDNAGSRTSRGRIDRDRSQAITERNNKSQSGTSRCSADVANTVVIGQPLQVAGQQSSSKQFASDGSKRRVTNNSRQWWAIEPDVGRVAHGIPNRVDRLRCLGNAVVPQVAEYVGRLIMAAQ